MEDLTVKTYTATVLGTRQLSAHLVTVTLGASRLSATGVPDEYVRVLIPPVGAELALPEIDEKWTITYPEGRRRARLPGLHDLRPPGRRGPDPDRPRHRAARRGHRLRLGPRCQPGDQVGLIEPHGLYAAPADVGWQLLVADITGLPAAARILRGLFAGSSGVVIVLTDPATRSRCRAPPTSTSRGRSSEGHRHLRGPRRPSRRATCPPSDRYVWLAGEARASRAVRRHLRRELSGRSPTSTRAATGRSRPRSGTPATRRSPTSSRRVGRGAAAGRRRPGRLPRRARRHLRVRGPLLARR